MGCHLLSGKPTKQSNPSTAIFPKTMVAALPCTSGSVETTNSDVNRELYRKNQNLLKIYQNGTLTVLRLNKRVLKIQNATCFLAPCIGIHSDEIQINWCYVKL